MQVPICTKGRVLRLSLWEEVTGEREGREVRECFIKLASDGSEPLKAGPDYAPCKGLAVYEGLAIADLNVVSVVVDGGRGLVRGQVLTPAGRFLGAWSDCDGGDERAIFLVMRGGALIWYELDWSRGLRDGSLMRELAKVRIGRELRALGLDKGVLNTPLAALNGEMASVVVQIDLSESRRVTGVLRAEMGGRVELVMREEVEVSDPYAPWVSPVYDSVPFAAEGSSNVLLAPRMLTHDLRDVRAIAVFPDKVERLPYPDVRELTRLFSKLYEELDPRARERADASLFVIRRHSGSSALLDGEGRMRGALSVYGPDDLIHSLLVATSDGTAAVVRLGEGIRNWMVGASSMSPKLPLPRIVLWGEGGGSGKSGLKQSALFCDRGLCEVESETVSDEWAYRFTERIELPGSAGLEK